MHKLLLIIAAGLIFTGCKKELSAGTAADIFNNPLQSQLDKDVHQLYMDHAQKMKAVSISIGILENNSFHTYGYGETILGNKRPPAENTLYEIGSISKVFTALTASAWLQQNNISLTAGISNYLPAYIPVLQKNGVPVSFKHLLTHSAGMPRDPAEIILSNNIPQAYAAFDSIKLYNYLKTLRLNTVPGSFYDYSNTGFGIIGSIMERQTHKSFEALIKEKVTDVLGMSNTGISLSAAAEQQAAKPYEGRELQPAIKFQAFNAAGGIKSTTGDLLKLANASINYTGNSGLTHAMKECEKIQFSGPEAGGGMVESGLAWSYLPLAIDNQYALVHPGTTFGHSSVLIINKKDKKALVLFITMPATSTEEAAMQEFGNKLITRAFK
jgi:CubicO group peptidase (beta-lactamase class C family)